MKRKVYKPEDFVNHRLEVDCSIDGEFLMTNTVEGAHGAFKVHYLINTEYGAAIAVFGAALLNFQMQQIQPGERIRISYEGKSPVEVPRASGTCYIKQFTVRRIK